MARTKIGARVAVDEALQLLEDKLHVAPVHTPGVARREGSDLQKLLPHPQGVVIEKIFELRGGRGKRATVQCVLIDALGGDGTLQVARCLRRA
jgi:hypothetical protein